MCEGDSFLDSCELSNVGLHGAVFRDPMLPCPKRRPRRRDRLGVPEHDAHEAHASMRRGRPISRGAGLGLLLLPVQYTAALRPSARPAIPSAEAYRSFPSGRGSRDSHGGSSRSSSSRRCGGVALDAAEHAGQAAMFRAQQQQAEPGDIREGSLASGAPTLGNEDERCSNGGGEGSVDLRDHHHHLHPG